MSETSSKILQEGICDPVSATGFHLTNYLFWKRLIDIISSTIGIILCSPLLLAVAIAIKLDTPGPVFADIPKRVGKNGKLFRMYKFRSMVTGAHEILQKNPELLKLYKQNSYKLDTDKDPRVTRVGKIIRKSSIDELAQLFNILKGEMSMVGPRAYYPFELEEQKYKYPECQEYIKFILQAKPGLTGLWQISGRSEINFDKRVEMDAQYVIRKSVLYDLWIILMTIPAVILGKGAI